MAVHIAYCIPLIFQLGLKKIWSIFENLFADSRVLAFDQKIADGWMSLDQMIGGQMNVTSFH